jgi:DNA polymerase-1
MQTIGYIIRPEKIRYLRADGSTVVVKNPLPSGKLVIPGEGPLGKFKRTWIDYHELPYLKATLRAQRRGFPYNIKKAQSMRKKCADDIEVVLKTLYRAAGKKINLKSNPQIVKYLFQPNGVATPYRTKKGAVCLNAKAMARMKGSHPLVDALEKHKSLTKLQEVYIGNPNVPDGPKGLGLEYYVSKAGRIHCTMNTIGAITGRGSAQNPNLTQVPSAKDVYAIKDAFEPPKGMDLLCLDYAQLEIRVMAILSKDPAMAKILCDPKGDIHTNTANKFGVARSPTAKQINFLMLYGGMEYMLAEKLTTEGVPTEKSEARVYIDTYDQVYFRVSEYRKELLTHHQEHGYVRLLTGRRRWLDDVDWEDDYSVHKAETTLSNNVVQGSGQDLLKASIIRCDPECLNVDRILPDRIDMHPRHRLLLRDYASKIEKYRRIFKLAKCVFILQVHDEVIYFCDSKASQEVGQLIAEVMTWNHFFPAITSYNVPLVAEGGVGHTWRHAKSKEPLFKLHAGL